MLELGRLSGRWTASNSLVSALLGLLVFVPLIASLNPDRIALLELKKSLQQPESLAQLSNWEEDNMDGDPDPCRWSGVQCDQNTRRVVSVNITGSAECRFSPCPWKSHSHSCPNTNQNQKVCTSSLHIPASIGNLTQLQFLFLPFNGLSGSIPTEIADLQFLEVIDLQGNLLSGLIPVGFRHLNHLHVLNLAYNNLVGGIPSTLAKCQSLQFLNLAGNMLSGKIPSSLFSSNLSSLGFISMADNQLDGIIPSELSCPSLEHLDLSGNFLAGIIPDAIGNCSRLLSLKFSSNFLAGRIPIRFGQLSNLRLLDVSRNSLDGEIPSDLGNCTNLSSLILTNLFSTRPYSANHSAVDPLEGYTSDDKGEFNYFMGGIPTTITSLPSIRVIWAPSAGLTGELPPDWGQCVSLELLNLAGNYFVGGIPSRLGRCRRLQLLDLSSNQLTGNLPGQLPITCLALFNVSGNLLSGNITQAEQSDCPKEVLKMASLYCATVAGSLPKWFRYPANVAIIHDFSRNKFTGLIPDPILAPAKRFTGLAPAYRFLLSGNHFSGAIPRTMFESCQSFCAFSISLSRNKLSGPIPWKSMAGCQNLVHFEAASSNLEGSIPSEIAALQHLVYLDLAANRIHGGIPPQFGQLGKLQYAYLANNSLVGAIPVALGGLLSLVVLDLSGNKLSGTVPTSFASLGSLVVLNLAHNNLSGVLPRMVNMEALCASGQSFEGNHLLEPCVNLPPPPVAAALAVEPPNGLVKESRQSYHHLDLIKIIAIIVTGTIVLIIIILLFLVRRAKRRLPTKKEVVTFGDFSYLTYENIVRATGGFSINNLIGNGGFGATYKAEPMPGVLVAVKRLSMGRFLHGVQQFCAEIQTLGQIWHPNLVTLLGYHVSDSEMFLIYNYLPGGNLESLIHENQVRGLIISWGMRYKIALDIAKALAYLHDECTPRVLHRDIKPSNILLGDGGQKAYLSDFGLARLLESSETHVTTDVAGTFGYVAPEYAMTCRVSDKADVYSYGVVLLELLSGKRALDPSFSHYGNGFNIVAWASQQVKSGKAKEAFALGLWDEGSHSQLLDVLKLALSCTMDALPDRPTMPQVVHRLLSMDN